MRKLVGTAVAAAWMLSGLALAQEKGAPQLTPEEQKDMDAYMKAGTPGEEHKKLAATAGSYSIKIKSWMEPGGTPMEEVGTATRTMVLDGRVLLEDIKATMMGAPYAGHGMSGFDNVSGKYWATWTDNMSTGMVVSDGTCDAKNTCSYTGRWNDPIKKGPVTCHITSRWPTPTTQIFELVGPDKKGKDFKMMEMTYTKQ
jgi:hypothetical protein